MGVECIIGQILALADASREFNKLDVFATFVDVEELCDCLAGAGYLVPNPSCVARLTDAGILAGSVYKIGSRESPVERCDLYEFSLDDFTGFGA